MSKTELFTRLTYFFIGVMILSLGVALTISAGLGTSSWDVLHLGLFYTFGLSVGTWSQIVGFIFVILIYLVDKKMVYIGTVLNMISVGFFIDLFLYILPTMSNIYLNFLILILGIIVLGIGSGLYISSDLGPGPRDGFVLAIAKRYHWSIRLIKTIVEIFVVIIGWFLGGPVFIGTLIISFTIGPIMQYSMGKWEKILQPVFLKIKKEQEIIVKGENHERTYLP